MGVLKIRLLERLGQIAAAMKLQVHVEEGHVGDGIDAAESLVEFDAVDHHHLLGGRGGGLEVDVVEVQIAVRFTGAPRGRALFNQRKRFAESLVEALAEAVEARLRNGLADLVCREFEIGPQVLGDHFTPGPAGHFGRAAGVVVEGGQSLAEAIHQRDVGLAVDDCLLEGQARIKAAHLDGILDRFSRPFPPQSLGGLGDRHDSQIDTRGEAAVEFQFGVAVGQAEGEGAEVEERQSHWLADLVGKVPRDEHDRDVRLVNGDRRHGLGEGPWLREVGDQAGEIHGAARPFVL